MYFALTPYTYSLVLAKNDKSWTIEMLLTFCYNNKTL